MSSLLRIKASAPASSARISTPGSSESVKKTHGISRSRVLDLMRLMKVKPSIPAI